MTIDRDIMKRYIVRAYGKDDAVHLKRVFDELGDGDKRVFVTQTSKQSSGLTNRELAVWVIDLDNFSKATKTKKEIEDVFERLKKEIIGDSFTE